jgi:hypothetical protein
MADTSTQVQVPTSDLNGVSLEAKLRQLYARQDELRTQLEATRAELNRVSAEVLRTQQEYCTDPGREEEYWQCLKNILGEDPREFLKEIEAAKANPTLFEDLLKELEQIEGR